MPINVTITAEELKELLAARAEVDIAQQERGELRSTLRLVTAEGDLTEERPRAYRCRRTCQRKPPLSGPNLQGRRHRSISIPRLAGPAPSSCTDRRRLRRAKPSNMPAGPR